MKNGMIIYVKCHPFHLGMAIYPCPQILGFSARFSIHACYVLLLKYEHLKNKVQRLVLLTSEMHFTYICPSCGALSENRRAWRISALVLSVQMIFWPLLNRHHCAVSPFSPQVRKGLQKKAVCFSLITRRSGVGEKQSWWLKRRYLKIWPSFVSLTGNCYPGEKYLWGVWRYPRYYDLLRSLWILALCLNK